MNDDRANETCADVPHDAEGRTILDPQAGCVESARGCETVAYWPTYDSRTGLQVGFTPVGAPITWVAAPREDTVARVFRWLARIFSAAAGDAEFNALSPAPNPAPTEEPKL